MESTRPIFKWVPHLDEAVTKLNIPISLPIKALIITLERVWMRSNFISDLSFTILVGDAEEYPAKPYEGIHWDRYLKAVCAALISMERR